MPKRKSSTLPLGEHPDTEAQIQRAMNSAVRKAIAENDRLGVPSVGAVGGRIVYRQPLRGTARARRKLVNVNVQVDREAAAMIAELIRRALSENVVRLDGRWSEPGNLRNALETLKVAFEGRAQSGVSALSGHRNT